MYKWMSATILILLVSNIYLGHLLHKERTEKSQIIVHYSETFAMFQKQLDDIKHDARLAYHVGVTDGQKNIITKE